MAVMLFLQGDARPANRREARKGIGDDDVGRVLNQARVWENDMTSRPPVDGLGAMNKRDRVLGVWSVAKAALVGAVSYSPPAPSIRVVQSGASRCQIEAGTTPSRTATDDLEAVSPLPESWPRVLPGL
jgi:hypothetical protein